MKTSKRMARGDGFAFELETKKNLGQNFLADKTILAQIISRAELHAGKSNRFCVEIGPGSGALTRQLLEAGWTVWAVEKDKRAVEGLAKSLGAEFKDRLHVIEDDILRVNVKTLLSNDSITPLCIGNIPYYITSDILFWFLNGQKHFSAALLMIQKEVAERLASAPGQKDYGRLTVRAQLSARIEQVLIAPAKAFVPPPKVDSAVVELVPYPEPALRPEEEKRFERFTAHLFSARRKMIRKTLMSIAQELRNITNPQDETWQTAFEEKALQQLKISFQQRPEELSPSTLLKLFRLLIE